MIAIIRVPHQYPASLMLLKNRSELIARADRDRVQEERVQRGESLCHVCNEFTPTASACTMEGACRPLTYDEALADWVDDLHTLYVLETVGDVDSLRAKCFGDHPPHQWDIILSLLREAKPYLDAFAS